MKIGFMGLGKLGLPCALACENVGHEVVGYDPSPLVANILATKKLPYVEEGAQALLDKTNIRLVGPRDLVDTCDLIFVAVQTPHHPRYEGVTRIPARRVDFDYAYLKTAMTTLSQAVEVNHHMKRVGMAHNDTARVVVISTVLPGTIDREIRPLLYPGIKLCYNPFFIAMGTTIRDFTHPEFVLFGVDDPETAEVAETFYRTLHDRPFYKTGIKEAELIKVAYNTFISTKIAFVNTLMEICHKTGTDVDAVTDALKMGNERLISTRYLTAGMGDGGGCHPRDNIALSWLARKLDMGFDFFEAIMLQRERQTDWFADVIEEHVNDFLNTHRGSFYRHIKDVPVIILGESFKPETNLVVGSPAVLLGNVLRERGLNPVMFDPIVNPDDKRGLPDAHGVPAVFFIGTRHQIFSQIDFPPGSVVIDPHRYVKDQAPNVKLVKLGAGLP